MLGARRATLIICLCTAATFAQGLGNGFAWDDHSVIEGSKRIRDPRSIYRVFLHSSSWIIGDRADTPLVTYRPLAEGSMALDYALWGPRPFGFHLTSLLLHIACALVFWQLLLRLSVAADAALWLALVFALHPCAVEAVTWINGRSEPMCLLFGLAALLVACRARIGVAAAAGLAILICLSLLGKETGALFVVVAAGLLLRPGWSRHALAGLAALAGGVAVYVVLRQHALSPASLPAGPMLATGIAALPALWFRSLQIVLVPLDLGLENLVAWQNEVGAVERALFAVVAAATVVVAAACLLRRRPLGGLGLFWWLAALIPPSLTLATGGYWPGLSRWVYVGLPGLLLGIAAIVPPIPRKKWIYAVAGAALLFLAFETQGTISVWRGDRTILLRMIADYPKDWYAYLRLARISLAEGDAPAALAVVQAGIAACGPVAKLECMQGLTLATMGACDEAEGVFAAQKSCGQMSGIDPSRTLANCRGIAPP
jgi:protein O-mannosyl-transferase